jgi:hypothetical protein
MNAVALRAAVAEDLSGPHADDDLLAASVDVAV